MFLSGASASNMKKDSSSSSKQEFLGIVRSNLAWDVCFCVIHSNNITVLLPSVLVLMKQIKIVSAAAADSALYGPFFPSGDTI